MGSDRLTDRGGQHAAVWGGAGLLLAGMLVLVLVIYQEAMLYLVGIWSRYEDGPYGHGFLVLAVSLYLVYARRRQLFSLVPCPSAGALPVVAGCVLVWMMAALVDIQMLQVVVLLPLVLSTFWAVGGQRIARQLLFPVLFISFALPVWSPLLPALREVTVGGAFFLVRLSGITAFLHGYEVQLPSGKLMVEDACSGLNYLMAGIALGVFHAYLNYQGLRPRLLIVATVACSAILANILRVFTIIYLAYISNMQHPMVHDHLMLGWYLFGALVVLLLLLDHQIHRRRKQAVSVVVDHADADRVTRCNISMPWRIVLIGVATALVATGPAAAWWIKHRVAAVTDYVIEQPPGQGGWTGPVPQNDGWEPMYHGAVENLRGYYRDDVRVLLYTGIYQQQSQGRELINDLNLISSGSVWQQIGAERTIVSSAGQALIEAELVSPGNQRRLVWYWYRVAGHYTTSQTAAKILQLVGLATGHESAAVIALAADNDGDIAQVRREMDDFLAAMGQAIAQFVDDQTVKQEQIR